MHLQKFLSYEPVIFHCLPLEQTMDLTSLISDVQKVKARKELWELIAVYTTWMEEWKQLLFSEVTCQINLSLIDRMVEYVWHGCIHSDDKCITIFFLKLLELEYTLSVIDCLLSKHCFL